MEYTVVHTDCFQQLVRQHSVKRKLSKTSGGTPGTTGIRTLTIQKLPSSVQDDRLPKSMNMAAFWCPE